MLVSRKCFPEYQGKDEYTEASEYIQAQFVAQNKSEQKVRRRRLCQVDVLRRDTSLSPRKSIVT